MKNTAELGARRPLSSTLADLSRGRFLFRTLGPPQVPRLRETTLETATFDIFDTLIGRTVARPHELHLVTARKIADIGLATDAESFSRLRVLAESEADRDYRSCPTLIEIHERLARLAGWDEDLAFRTAAAEIEAELAISRPLTRGPALLEEARNRGLRIIFVSDMHLPSVTVRSMLDAAGCWRAGDALWVSSEARSRKRDGSLFQLVRSTEGLDPRRTVHVGDHPISDRIVPTWLGFGVVQVERE